MIEQKAFKDCWQLLCERFGRDPSRALAAAYHRSLSPRMTTEQFQRAAARIFDGAEFFPKPADFLAEVRQRIEHEALAQWEVVQDLMRGFDVEAKLTPEARRVVRMLGGASELGQTPIDRVAFVRRDFLELYGDAAEISAREERLLTETTPEGREVLEAAMKGPDAVMALAAKRRNGKEGTEP